VDEADGEATLVVSASRLPDTPLPVPLKPALALLPLVSSSTSSLPKLLDAIPARLRRCSAFWMQSDRWAGQIVSEGLMPPFLSLPPFINRGDSRHHCRRASPQLMQNEIDTLVSSGAVRTVSETELKDFPGVISRVFPVPKEGQADPIRDKPPNDQSLCEIHKIQDGRIAHTAPSSATVRLHGEDRPSRCVSSHSHPSKSATVLPIPMGQDCLPVAVRSLWLHGRTSDIHPSDEGDSKRSPSTRPSSNSLHGRHSLDVSLSRQIYERSRSAIETFIRLRFHNQPEEMRTNSIPDDGLSWHGSGLTRDDPLTTAEEVDRVVSALPQDANPQSSRQVDRSASPSETSRPPPSSLGLCVADKDAFEHSSRSSALSGEGQQVHSLSVGASDCRPSMVGRSSPNMEWKEPPRSNSGLSVRHGRERKGLGSSLLSAIQPEATGMSGILHLCDVQQHSRVIGSAARDNVVNTSELVAGLCDPSSYRQSSYDELCESNGRSRTASRSHSGADSSILLGTSDSSLSNLSPRSPELGSGLSLSSGIRQFRVETAPIAVRPDQQSLGSTHSGRASISDKLDATTVCELSSRSSLPLHGSLQSSTGREGELLLVPASSRNSDSTLSSEANQRTSHSNNHPSSVAIPAMVAPRVAPVPGLALASTAPPRDTVELGRRQGNNVNAVLAISRSTIIRQQLVNQGFPNLFVDYWFGKNKGGEARGTNKGYDEMWAKYSTWCERRGGRPLDFHLPHIIQYVTDVLLQEEKLSNARCRSFLSMCSVTRAVLHPHMERLSKNPLVIDFRKGLNLLRPGKDSKPRTYFSIFKLLQHVATLSPNDDTCPIGKLRDKLVLLLLVDGMARASDVASITREGIRFEEDKAYYSYYFTKENKAPQETRTFVTGVPHARNICTVTVLKKYLDRTSGPSFICEKIPHLVDGKEVLRTPLLLYEWKRERKLYPGLGSQRVSKIGVTALQAINVSEFKTHGIRGAASSKARNLGSPADVICARARWGSEATFNKFYFKQCAYITSNLQLGMNLRDAPLEWLLRLDAKRVGF
jgi:hypothetical protein